MNKIFKTASRLAGITIVFAFFPIFIACQTENPGQRFVFINSSTNVKSVSFEMKMDDSSYTETAVNNLKIKSGEKIIKKLPVASYNITVKDANNNVIGEIKDYSFKLAPDNDPDFSLIHFDLALDKKWTIVTLNHMYQGNKLVDSISEEMGNSLNMKVMSMYYGAKPFQVVESYRKNTFLDFGDKLPQSIKDRELVYGLIPVPDSINLNEDFYLFCQRYINSHYF